MPIEATEKIWMNGELVPWADARIHVLTHSLHYGMGVFEGIRAYETADGPAVFRLTDHMVRLHNSAKILGMEIPYSVDELVQATKDVVRSTGLPSCYIRPIVLRGYGGVGVLPANNPTEIFLACWEWGKYLGPEALEKGVDVRVSSWTRSAPNTFPTMAKSVANYASGQLIKMEAVLDGYTEGIALDVNGQVSEGSGENIFLIRDGVICTPPLHSSVLPGITRDSVIAIARDLGYEVRQEVLQREALYIADELFFAGTAAEITPVRSVDKIVVGAGKRGPITKAIQTRFFDIIAGRAPDAHGWLTYVYPGPSGADTQTREKVVTG